MKITYRTNNSGGSWWLKDEDWSALEKAGWAVEWYATSTKTPAHIRSREGRWLGALATEASKDFETPVEAMREFERITGQDVSAEGCNCCGSPHYFQWGEGKKYASAYGEGCLPYLFPEGGPKTLREAYEKDRG